MAKDAIVKEPTVNCGSTNDTTLDMQNVLTFVAIERYSKVRSDRRQFPSVKRNDTMTMNTSSNETATVNMANQVTNHLMQLIEADSD